MSEKSKNLTGRPNARAKVLALAKARAIGIFVLLATLELAGLALLLWQPTVEQALQPHLIQHSQGHSYVISLVGVAPRAYRIIGDSQQHPLRSDLILFRDGRPIGKPHSLHAQIAADGGGAYSHWLDVLYFSTPTNTNPRNDGYRYAYRAHAILSSPGREGLIVALVLGPLVAVIALRQSALWPRLLEALCIRSRVAEKVASYLFEGVRGRILASLIVFAVAATELTDNWPSYYLAPDSRTYLANQFVEPALRPPIVSIWLGLFSDRDQVEQRVNEVARSGNTNRSLLGDRADPILPAIQAQRLFLLISFVALTYVVAGLASFPGTVLGMSAAATGIAAINPSMITGAIVLLCLFTLLPLLIGLPYRRAKPNGGTGVTYESPLEVLVRVAAVTVVAHLFSTAILQNSFLSSEQHYLLSEALAMCWHLLFAASVLWFIRKRQGAALVCAGLLAGLGYLTRSASVFLLLAFAVLLLLALFFNQRKLIGFGLGALAMTALIVYAVPISWSIRDPSLARPIPMVNWGLMAFAIEVAKGGDERLLSDSESKQFLSKALTLRDSPSSPREVTPAYLSANLNANLFRIAIPVAREMMPHAFCSSSDELWPYAAPRDVDDLFGRVSRPILRKHITDYANMVREAALVATGLHPTSRSTRLFESPWHWIALAFLLTLTCWGRERDLDISLAAGLLIGMHVVHVGIVSAFDIPIIRYVHATEIFVVVAIVLLLDYHVRVIWKSARKNWRISESWRSTVPIAVINDKIAGG